MASSLNSNLPLPPKGVEAEQEEEDYGTDEISNTSKSSWRKMKVRRDTSKNSSRIASCSPSNWTRYLRTHWTSLLVSGLVFGVMVTAGMLTTSMHFNSIESEEYRDVLDLANETADFFINALEYKALTPLFSLAQFATEIPLFRQLPDAIGPASSNGSLPFQAPARPDLQRTNRNMSGSPCEDPSNIERYNEIAATIKENANMPGVLLQLYFFPQAVCCFVHPLINTQDFADQPGVSMNATAQLGYDMLTDVKLRYHAEKTLRSNGLVVTGPITLRHCVDQVTCNPVVQKAIVLRLPVKLPGHPITLPTTNETVDRWGFVVGTLNWKALVDQSGIYPRFQHLGREFTLSRKERLYGDQAETTQLAQSPGFHHNDTTRDLHTLDMTIQTPTSEWKITVHYPTTQSQAQTGMRIAVVLLSLVVAALVGVVLIQKQDMIAKTRIQQARVETERNMTAYFAHELRNPVSAIESALLAMPDGASPKVQEIHNGMKLCTSFMTRIMNNLCDVRQLEEGCMEFHNCPLELDLLVKETHSMLLPSVQKGVDFSYRINIQPNQSNHVVGDFHRIFQVLTNITSNALKYCKSGSVTLSVAWDDTSGRVCFECKDTGPGIPKKDQAQLFQRFVKRGGAPGTGLGLAISKHIVDSMKGEIYFESDPIVKPGAICVVLLPLEACPSPEKACCPEATTKGRTGTAACTPQQQSTQPKPIEEDISILIVDDIKMNRLMLKKRFVKCVAPNATISEAATGEAALELFRVDDPPSFHVIVMDQYMESAGGALLGTDAIIAMRRMGVSSMIIGCSGNDMEQAFLEAGADCVWKKPMPSNAEMICQLCNGLRL